MTSPGPFDAAWVCISKSYSMLCICHTGRGREREGEKEIARCFKKKKNRITAESLSRLGLRLHRQASHINMTKYHAGCHIDNRAKGWGKRTQTGALRGRPSIKMQKEIERETERGERGGGEEGWMERDKLF